MIALPVEGKPELVECDPLGRAEYRTQGLTYVAIGSGQPIADPFLAFLYRMFWPDPQQPMTLAQGILVTLWAVIHAIRVAPGGVGEPIQTAVLEGRGGNMRARLLDPTELDEHRQSVSEAEAHIASYTL